MLYIFGGLPGSGKTSLSRKLAQELRALHLRIDTIEVALQNGGMPLAGPEGYVVAHRVAVDNLRLGLGVVADSVNPLRITRDGWRGVAREAGVPFVEIEVICSNQQEHRQRVESRLSDIAGLTLPTWEQVMQREYEPWDTAPIVIDTAGQTVEESAAILHAALQHHSPPHPCPPLPQQQRAVRGSGAGA